MLEYDGKKIVQSVAMARFVARENGLAGKNNLEGAYADMLVDCMWDLANSKYKYLTEGRIFCPSTSHDM